MTRVTIRRATSHDIDALAALQRRSMRVLAADHYTVAQIEAFIAAAGPDLAPLLTAGTTYGAWSDGELIASAAWHFEGALPTLGMTAKPDHGTAVFRAVYVRPDRSRAGLGSTMMDRVEAEARMHGASRAHLHAMLNATEFYRKRGYRVLGEAAFDLAGVRFPGVSMTRALAGVDAEDSMKEQA